MTTPNRMNLKNLMNGMLFGALVVMLMLATVGCDKKKSSNNARYNGGFCVPGQICQQPGFPGQPGFGQPGYGQGIVGLGYDQMSGSPVFMEFVTAQQGYQDPYFASGQTYVYGQIDLNNGMQCGFTGGWIQPDSYSLESQYPSNIQNGVLSNAQLIGRGLYGNQITVNVSYATMQSPYGGVGSGSQYLPLMASMTITTANGVPCNQYLSVQP